MGFTPSEFQGPDSLKLWLRLVSEDIKAADTLLKVGQNRNSVLLSAAAAEKAIKAYLFSIGSLDERSRSHNTFILAQNADFFVSAPDVIKTALVSLSKIHVPASYPESEWEYRSITESGFAQTVYNQSYDVICWVIGEIARVRGDEDGRRS